MPNDIGYILFSIVDQQWEDENLLERIWNHLAPFVFILVPSFMLAMIFFLGFVLSVEAKDNNKRKFLHELMNLPMEQGVEMLLTESWNAGVFTDEVVWYALQRGWSIECARSKSDRVGELEHLWMTASSEVLSEKELP